MYVRRVTLIMESIFAQLAIVLVRIVQEQASHNALHVRIPTIEVSAQINVPVMQVTLITVPVPLVLLAISVVPLAQQVN